MDQQLEQIILQGTSAERLYIIESIQSLWSGYGEILRVGLEGSKSKTVIVKHIRLPQQTSHPRGWSTDLGHQRKVKSYQVEMNFYREYAKACDQLCRVPNYFVQDQTGEEQVIVLEDLDAAGYDLRKSRLEEVEFNACIAWLAHFHAKFLGVDPKGLWDEGTYWHLDTRPDELEVLDDIPLKQAAKKIDEKLKSCRYRTLVHGDAKVANFCFSKQSHKVAAVDFQYIGGGSGMKDLAYFVGSCLSEKVCEKKEEKILKTYFSEFKKAVELYELNCDVADLETSWRALYPLAWADFHRFLKGWSPGHWKIHSYSERLTKQVLESL